MGAGGWRRQIRYRTVVPARRFVGGDVTRSLRKPEQWRRKSSDTGTWPNRQKVFSNT